MITPKIFLHVYVPVTAVFILNNWMFLSLDRPGYLIVNILSFGVVVSISIISLQFLKVEKPEEESSPVDLSEEAQKVEEVYDDLKKLLAETCTKENLVVAKELVRICSKLGPVSAELNNKAPRKKIIKKSSLRSVYRSQIHKSA